MTAYIDYFMSLVRIKTKDVNVLRIDVTKMILYVA